MMKMSKLQKDFYNIHKDELDLIDSEPIQNSKSVLTPFTNSCHIYSFFSDVIAPQGNVISCAVGVASYLNRTPIQASAKCILCQEETSSVATETDKSFVMAANVQRSSVLRKSASKVSETSI